jgi:AcrR family transcriptional regulator
MTVRRDSGTRSSSDRGSTREAILAAARHLIAGGGELSIHAVAAEAGVSRQTVHAHFGGARGLRAALVAEGAIVATPEEATSTRDRLIEAAVRLLSAPGGGFATIEAIAAEAGLTKGAVYHHFADRGEILRAVARRVSPVDEMKVRIAPVAELPPRDGLIAIATAYYDAMRARTDLIRNLAVNSARDPELTGIVMGEIIGQGAPLVLAWFAYHVSRGTLKPVDPSLVIQALFGPVFLLIVLGPDVFNELPRAGIHPAVDNVEAYVDMLLSGISPANQGNGGTE